MLSIRQPLTASPSVNLSGLAPFTANIATRCPGSVTIPVSLVSPKSALGLSFPAFCGGRRVLLNSGRASTTASNSSIRELGCRCMAATPGLRGSAPVALRLGWSSLAGCSSMKTITAKIRDPARSSEIAKRAIMAFP
jgi:hypothetical protein